MEKSYLFLLFLNLSILSIQAQIFQPKEDVIKELESYESGVADDGSEYIYFDSEIKTEASGVYTRRKVVYFVELEGGDKICNMWKILEPSSETNSTVGYFKKKYVEVDYMQWKDYENEILYNVKVEDDLCIVTAQFNNSK